MPMTSAQLTTAVAETAQDNPTVTITPVTGVGGGTIVTLTIRYEGVTYDPAALLAGLRAAYGATKVTSDRDTFHGRTLEVTIKP